MDLYDPEKIKLEKRIEELETANRSMSETLRSALQDAHACREALTRVQERCTELIEEARAARSRERNARAIIEAAIAGETPAFKFAVGDEVVATDLLRGGEMLVRITEIRDDGLALWTAVGSLISCGTTPLANLRRARVGSGGLENRA